jgi:hypothetical protein
LAGDDRRPASVTLFKDLKNVLARSDRERLQSAIIKNKQLDATERSQEAGIAAVAASKREIGEELGNALIEDRAVVAASLVTECAGYPAFANSSWPVQIAALTLRPSKQSPHHRAVP